MKRIIFIVAMILLVVVNVSSLATIGYHKWCRYREYCALSRSRAGSESLYSMLALSADQIVRMDSLRKSLAGETAKTEKMILKEKSELMDLLEASAASRENIHAVQGRIDSLQAHLQNRTLFSILEEKEMLTSEQKKKYFSILRERLCGCAVNETANGVYSRGDEKMNIPCSQNGCSDKTMEGGESE